MRYPPGRSALRNSRNLRKHESTRRADYEGEWKAESRESRVESSEQSPLSTDSELPLTRIKPASGWQVIDFRELWRFRELLYFLTWRDVKVRYKQTALGAAWAILQPLCMMIVFSMFLGR